MKNPLREWLGGDVHAKGRLAAAAGLRWQTIDYIAKGQSVPRPSTARAIEQATDGAVRAADLLAYFAEVAR
jgi:hypothetical protein